MSDTSAAEQVAPVYIFYTGDFLLDAPVEAAWPTVVDYPSWQNYPVVKHISGDPGEEGEVVLLQKDEAGWTSPPFYSRILKLEPGRRIIWKVWPKEPDPYFANGFFGFVDFSVAAEGDKTRFFYDNIYEFLVPYQDESALEAFRKQRYQDFDPVFDAIWGHLREAVAAKAIAAGASA